MSPLRLARNAASSARAAPAACRACAVRRTIPVRSPLSAGGERILSKLQRARVRESASAVPVREARTRAVRRGGGWLMPEPLRGRSRPQTAVRTCVRSDFAHATAARDTSHDRLHNTFRYAWHRTQYSPHCTGRSIPQVVLYAPGSCPSPAPGIHPSTPRVRHPTPTEASQAAAHQHGHGVGDGTHKHTSAPIPMP